MPLAIDPFQFGARTPSAARALVATVAAGGAGGDPGGGGGAAFAAVPHPLNWFAGWGLVLLAFVTGAVVGLRFHRERFSAGTRACGGGWCGWGTSRWRRWG